ncbi:alpha/beta hydrolase [Microbacterium phyllosphaerae]|uniref:alpha/beta hydrolase n=1 Tax=Microbacterium phyllosphaerae TaxID=124798 RepID=UPI0021693780|nr:alpha/beta hydrolase [Microbacterium phyllosphaerae]MCS3442401.1 acetyl esterase/lipase [Microbacterium phyllosphaerae]
MSDQVLDGPHGPLRVRVYTPENPTGPGLVWVHGGGFAAGEIEMPEADWVARSFADRGIVVVSVDYSLAPFPRAWAAAAGAPERDGVHYPVASDEVEAAFRWAVDSDLADGPWSIGGASAGGNLATGAALRLSHGSGPVPALAVLAYPTLHAVQGTPDAALRAALDADPEADTFGPDPVSVMYENYLGGSVDAADVYAVPGTASVEGLSRFPATIMINDEIDELRVSGEAFGASLTAAGVDLDISTEPGTRHGHLNRPEHAGATASIDRFAARILATSPENKEQP